MKTRALNGMGSIRQRKDGRFEGRYTGPDGKQHSLFGKTSQEVAKKLRAATASVDSGDWLQPIRITVSEWLDVWLRDYCAHVRPTTLDAYETNTRLHVRPVIGSIKLSSVNSAHVRRVLSAMTGAGLSARTVNTVRMIMGAAFSAACEAKLIRENPVGPVRRVSDKADREIEFLDREQIPAFVAAARQSHCANELLLLLFTGMRIGELLGLRWDRVNLDRAEITIDKQLVWHARQYTLTPTKSGLARTIHISPEAVDVLRAQRVKQNEQRIRAGHLWQSDPISEGLVFRTDAGRHMLFNTVQRQANRVGGMIDIPGLHPHSLRHSYAVAALRAGMDVKTLQNNLGHASASVTLDVYAKYTDDAGAAAARLLSAYFSSALQN